MAAEEDGYNVLDSQIILDSFASKQSKELLSPEDKAWVDSCLVKEAEILDGNWSYVTDALLEAVSSQPEATGSTMAEGDECLAEIDIAEFSSSENHGASMKPLDLQNAFADNQIDKEETENENSDSDNTQPQTSGRNVFRPNYSEFPEESLSTSSEFNLPPLEIEFSADQIFKVWDLDIPDEDDDFLKQLNKALGQSSVQSAPTDNLALWKDLNDESLDNLVAGLGDLSLS